MQVVGGRQPQVRGAVGEEHEQRAQHPAAVPQLVARPRAPRPGHSGAPGRRSRLLPVPARTTPGSSGRPLRPRAGRGRRSIRLRGHVGGAGGGERLPGGGGGGVRSGEDPVREAPASSSSSSLLPPPSTSIIHSPRRRPRPSPTPPGLRPDGGSSPWKRGKGGESIPGHPLLPSSEAWGLSHTLSASHLHPTALPYVFFSSPLPSPSSPLPFISSVYLQWPRSEEGRG